ncbi:phosphoglucomutase-like protein 5 isoform X4, partial [Daubentonia madagascariensis]
SYCHFSIGVISVMNSAHIL